LTYSPEKRISAQEALNHEWFKESPHPVPPSMFPTWPAKSEMGKPVRTGNKTPPPPPGRRANDKSVSLTRVLLLCSSYLQRRNYYGVNVCIRT